MSCWGSRKSLPAHTIICALAITIVACLCWSGTAALAQANHPFNVGISEGGGLPGTALARWLLNQQIVFERLMSGTVGAIATDASAFWTLIGIAFAYGVFHAAGPGHGKAVVASYMLANELELKRGLMISLMAAVLQGLVAIGLVAVLAVVLQATAAKMKSAASFVEIASYLAVALLGLWLVWRKGRALRARWSGGAAADRPVEIDQTVEQGVPVHSHAQLVGPGHTHVHDEHCGHFHAPDPQMLGAGFSWRLAVGTAFAAGLRPCSGAILVLVFALAQGVFYAGIAATVAMSLGTAITTGILAGLAVLAKKVAVVYIGGADGGSGRGLAALAVPLLEFAAAMFILLIGTLLFFGSLWL